MNSPLFRLGALCLAASLFAAPLSASAEDKAKVDAANSLLSNGNFEEGAANWPTGEGLEVVTEEENSFLRLTSPGPDKQVQAYRKVTVAGTEKKLTLTFRARWADIVQGAEAWHRASVILHFKDADGKLLKPDPKPQHFKGSSEAWEEFSMEIEVPEGATSLEIMPALFQIESGTLDLDDLVLVPAA